MDVDQFHNRIRELYLPSRNQFSIIDVPEIRYAVIDGKGNPRNEEGLNAIKWLFSVAHFVKPIVKTRMGKNFVEPPLEFLFWDENEEDFSASEMEQWNWRAMIVMVDWISLEEFEQAVNKVETKMGLAPKSLRLINLHEGKSVQIMHVGDYGGVKEICQSLYLQYLPEHQLKPNGFYHEIYLNDPTRTAPEKRKMVLRQPVIPSPT